MAVAGAVVSSSLSAGNHGIGIELQDVFEPVCLVGSGFVLPDDCILVVVAHGAGRTFTLFDAKSIFQMKRVCSESCLPAGRAE